MDELGWLGWVLEIAQLAVLGGGMWWLGRWTATVESELERLHRARRVGTSQRRRLKEGVQSIRDGFVELAAGTDAEGKPDEQ